jgi:flagellar export protein FliJ
MKKFRFSLQALLSYREYLEKVAMQDLAKAQSDVNLVTERIRELESHLAESRDELQSKWETGILASDMMRYMDYLQGLEQRIFEANMILERLVVIVSKKREILAVKSVEKKIISNLKDKRRAEYIDGALKLAQKDSDEMVLLTGSRDDSPMKEHGQGKG